MKGPRTVFWACLLCATGLFGFSATTRAEPTASKEHKTERFPIVLRVDFGPAGKGVHEKDLLVDSGTTAKDAVSMLFPIQSGEVCCNTREIAAIDGVRPDPAANRWWTCRLNDSTNISPFKTELKSGDHVEWRYIEESQ